MRFCKQHGNWAQQTGNMYLNILLMSCSLIYMISSLRFMDKIRKSVNAPISWGLRRVPGMNDELLQNSRFTACSIALQLESHL